uniref:Uncharacterized protein n=1 Tax=Acrobeloides nanus TaxID=290746 RepID=A0A914C6K5_9BILA
MKKSSLSIKTEQRDFYVTNLDSSQNPDDESDSDNAIDLVECCTLVPCCMNDSENAEFGHYVNIFMVTLIAFATFFCVNLILVLVFVLG